jgi:hypothetical protein
MFQKDGGCCSTAKVTGLKPCYYPLAPKTISLLKDNSKQRARTSQCPLHRRLCETKEKKAFQKRAASVTWPLRAMPAQFNRIMLFVSHSPSQAT